MRLNQLNKVKSYYYICKITNFDLNKAEYTNLRDLRYITVDILMLLMLK
jgi:hypothetical protein